MPPPSGEELVRMIWEKMQIDCNNVCIMYIQGNIHPSVMADLEVWYTVEARTEGYWQFTLLNSQWNNEPPIP